MNKPNKPKKAGKPDKRPRTEDELRAAAERLGQDWTPNDPVMPWIRKHEPELRALVTSGWTWDDIGLAMARAGITYKTGTPITGPVLRVKTYQARQAGAAKTDLENKPRYLVTPKSSSDMVEPKPHIDPLQRSQTPSMGHDGEPEFRPVRFRQTYTPPPPSQPALPPRPKPPKRTPEEVRAMLSGSAPEGS